MVSVSWPVASAAGETDVATAVTEEESIAAAARIELLPNYPNPFASQTRIPFTLQQEASARLQVFNALGQTVRELLDEQMQPGLREVLWDGRDESGQQVASGVYLSRLEVGDEFAATRPMLRLPGYAQLVPLENLDADAERDLGQLSQAVGTYGIATAPTPARSMSCPKRCSGFMASTI